MSAIPEAQKTIAYPSRTLVNDATVV